MFSRIGRRFARRRRRRSSIPSDTPGWLHSVISNPHSDVFREHLGRLRGGEHLEFLIVFSRFEDAGNGLQRFELLRALIHTFIVEGALRPIHLTPDCRHRVLVEWAQWSGRSRFPADQRLPALEEAVNHVHHVLVKQGPLILIDE